MEDRPLYSQGLGWSENSTEVGEATHLEYLWEADEYGKKHKGYVHMNPALCRRNSSAALTTPVVVSSWEWEVVIFLFYLTSRKIEW